MARRKRTDSLDSISTIGRGTISRTLRKVIYIVNFFKQFQFLFSFIYSIFQRAAQTDNKVFEMKANTAQSKNNAM